MGFFASYKRLSRKARIVLGLVGVVIGLAGPYIVPLLAAADKAEEKLRLNEETAVRETAPSWSDISLFSFKKTLLFFNERVEKQTCSPLDKMKTKERETTEKKNNGPTSALMVKYFVAIHRDL